MALKRIWTEEEDRRLLGCASPAHFYLDCCQIETNRRSRGRPPLVLAACDARTKGKAKGDNWGSFLISDHATAPAPAARARGGGPKS